MKEQGVRATARRERAIPTDDVALELWHLLSVESTGLALWEMEDRKPELTRHQIRRGLSRINQVLQESLEQPIICLPVRGRGHVYGLPESALDYRAFALRRLTELLTRAHTSMTGASSAVLRWPGELAPYLPKLLKRVTEDLEEILLELTEEDHEGEIRSSVAQ